MTVKNALTLAALAAAAFGVMALVSWITKPSGDAPDDFPYLGI